MFFIFHLLRIVNLTDSIVPRSLGVTPLLGLTPKLMGTISYHSDVNFFLIARQHREIILIIKGGNNHFLILSWLPFTLQLLILPQLVLKLEGNSIFYIIFASHTELLLNYPMVELGLGILMPLVLEAKVRVLTTVISNFREPFLFHVVKLLLIHQISEHSRTLNGGQTRFDQEDRIGSISFDLKVVGYEFLLNHVNLPP